MTTATAAKKAPPGPRQGRTPGTATPGAGGQGAAQPDRNSPPPGRVSRRGQVPLTPMRRDAAKSIRKLAAQVQDSHPDMTVHQHLRDAARVLESGNEEGAQRHLRAAAFALSPQSLMRNGKHTDDDHQAARAVMHGVHRHLLLVKDITDAAARNQQAIARDSYGDDSTAPTRPDPNAGYGPGALAQKPTARQPPGNQALNAPNRSSSGGSDPNVADPDGPQPRGSKQFANWNEVLTVIEAASPVRAVAYDWDHLSAVLNLATGDDCYRCHTPNAPDARYCKRCGFAMEPRQPYDRFATEDITCPFCGRGDDKTAVFCDQCGKRLPETAFAALANGSRAIGLSAQTAMLERTPAPIGKPGGPGLYHVKNLGHSNYYDQVRNGLMKRGVPEDRAHAMTWGILRRWAKGGGGVHPEVQAAAAKALAEEAQAAAKAHAHAVTRDDVARVVALTGDARHRHIPGSPDEWEHGYKPLTEAAAKSHGKGKVPKGWSAPSGGGGGKAAGPHLKFTDSSGRVSYHTVHDQETLGKMRAQAQQRHYEESPSGPADLTAAPKSAKDLHQAATEAGWNTSYYPGETSGADKYDDQGRYISSSGTPLHTVVATNPVTGQTVRQSWTGKKRDTNNGGESLQESMVKISRNPVTPEGLKAVGTPAGKRTRIASGIMEHAQEFSANGRGVNAQRVGYLMGQASDALRSGDQQKAVNLLRNAHMLSTTSGDVFAKGTGYAQTVIGKHLKSLGAEVRQFAYSWDDLSAVLEFAVRGGDGGTWDDVAGALELAAVPFNPALHPRAPSGQANGGQFAAGGAGSGPAAQQQGKGKAPAQQPAKPKLTAHQLHVLHVAHVNRVSTQKAELQVTAQDDRAKAAALIKQRDALVKALASAGGKVSRGQAGAKTSTTGKTKTSAPARSAKGTAPAKAPAATASGAPAKGGKAPAKAPAAKKATTAKAPAGAAAAPKAGSAAGVKAQIAQLNIQISALLTQAAAAEAQAAKMQ